MKKLILILFCFFSALVNAQTGFSRNISIPVDNGSPLELAWAGGINFPLFSEIDLNNDAVPDLFVFERTNNRVMTFINNGGAGTHCWEYAPQYEEHFPQMHGWAFLYDYNCDGKPDLLTVDYSNHGISQYRNDSQGGNLVFTLVDSTIQYICNCPVHFVNIIASEFLMPDFNDIDGDGDMDILGQQFICPGGFAYYKNMSMEDFGVCDSLNDYVLATNTWGNFVLRSGTYKNVIVGNWNVSCFNSGHEDSPYEIMRRDDTYAYIHSVDIDGDGDKDALIGDSQTNNSLLVINGGSSSTANMVSQDTLFPSYDLPVHIHSFASHANIDADNDGIKDLIVSQSEYENKRGVYFYKNTGTNAIPVYSHVENDFLQNKMIDVGECAAPVLFDYDGDGLKDLFIGNKLVTTSDSTYIAGLSLYKNTGTATSPSFQFITDDYAGLRTILSGSNVHGQIFPAFGDLDGDNDFDMVLGIDEGQLMYFMNTAGPGVTPVYAAPVFPFMSIDVGQASTPQLYDIDQDGMLDLVIGEKNGLLNYFKNVGSTSIPFYSSTPSNDSLGGAALIMHVQNPASPDGYSVPFLFDQGGSTRLLVSCMKGDIYLYGNIDGNLNGNYTLIDTVFSKVGGERYGYNLSVSGGDLNNDTLVDMVVGFYGGGPQIFFQDNNTNAIFSPDKSDLIRVMPNPVSETLLIRSLSTFDNLKCTLLDLTGRTILTQRLHGDFATINVSDITPGIYFLRVTSGKISVTKKIIVER